MKKIHILLIVLAAIFFIFISTTLAWFVDYFTVNDIPDGGVVTGYFARGDGSKETPFVITKPIHLYNLAWLQYMGILNQDDKDGGITQYYFELDPVDGNGNPLDALDMTGMILPPIGTTQYPFVGNFNGKGKCITNLTVSNYISDSDGVDLGIVTRPLSIDNVSNAEIIGFFGVVGDIGGMYKDRLDDKADENLDSNEEIDISSKVNAVYDLFLDNLIVRTETEQSLIGLLAGYVNGSLGNVGIGESSIELGSQLNDGINDDKIVQMTKIISAYSLIGMYDEETVYWVNVPGLGYVDDGGGNTGWGGSINMLELRQRIAYIVGAVGMEKSGAYWRVSEKFGFSGLFSGYQSDIAIGNSKTNQSYIGILDGTIMPLQIDSKLIFATPTTQTLNGYTFTTYKYYVDRSDKTSPEDVLAGMNSGYIVGGGNKTAPTSSNGDPYIQYKVEYVFGEKTGSSRNSGVGIFKSIGNAILTKAETQPFPENNLTMLTITPGGTTYVIKDDYNFKNGAWTANTWYTNSNNHSYSSQTYSELGLQKYQIMSGANDTGVRNAFVNGYSGESLLQALQFMPRINTSSPSTMMASDITLFSTTYESYEMIKGAINFSIQDAGIVTVVAGTCTYYVASSNTSVNASTPSSLFRIFKIERTGDDKNKTISSCKMVDKVYQTDAGKYVYVYSGQNDPYKNTTGYTPVYDASTMNKLVESGAVYYFEIPLGDGEYAIGNPSTDSYGAGILYLDIGANGDQSLEEDTDTASTHQISGITFVDDDGIKAKSTAAYSVIAYEIKLNENASTHSGLEVDFNRDSITQMYYYVGDPSGKFSVTYDQTTSTVQTEAKINPVQQGMVSYRRREETE